MEYDEKTLAAVAEKLEEVFWDAIGEGFNYEMACEEVDDWIGNNYIPDLLDPDTEELNEVVLQKVYSKIPSEEDFMRFKAETDSSDY